MSQSTLDLDYEYSGGEALEPTWGALFSSDRTYRYRLWRRFNDNPALVWLMLNPSVADESVNDPTIERCVRRAQAGGYGGITVLNLFALRATDPRELYTHADPVGPENDAHIAEVLRNTVAQGGAVVCAWGNNGVHRARHRTATELLQREGCRPLCLGVTREGQPRHPLYVGYGVELRPWEEVTR